MILAFLLLICVFVFPLVYGVMSKELCGKGAGFTSPFAAPMPKAVRHLIVPGPVGNVHREHTNYYDPESSSNVWMFRLDSNAVDTLHVLLPANETFQKEKTEDVDPFAVELEDEDDSAKVLGKIQVFQLVGEGKYKNLLRDTIRLSNFTSPQVNHNFSHLLTDTRELTNGPIVVRIRSTVPFFLTVRE